MSFSARADVCSSAANIRVLQRPADDFTLKLFRSGEMFRLSDYKGKIIVMSFWATWCVPCRTEMPAIDKKYRQNRDSENFVVLGVDLQQDEGIDSVKRFVGEVRAAFPILLDSDGSAEKA